VFIVITIAAVVITFFNKNYWPTGALTAYAVGLAYILPNVITDTKIMASDDDMLTYKVARAVHTVNLRKLTDCNYRLQFGGRRTPMMVFHLYDADGGATTFPANWWLNRKRLYATISQAVTACHVTINQKTSKKLGIASPERA